METATVTYVNDLRTEAIHVRSGQELLTDAPVDNKGRGEAFSPTDLLSTSLACCMITTIAIKAGARGMTVPGMRARVWKQMMSDPRKVGRIKVELQVEANDLDENARAFIEETARTCPVALSLHPDLDQEVQISFM